MTEQTSPSFHIGGVPLRLAVTPAALAETAKGSWALPPHWQTDPEKAFEAVWDRSQGLCYESGGGALLQDIGDGVYQVMGNLEPGDPDAALKLAATITYAFCATDCRRLLLTVYTDAPLHLAPQFGLYRFMEREVVDTEGKPQKIHYLAADMDEYAIHVGHALFHMEARRFGHEDKAYRIIYRYAMHTGDMSVLDFGYVSETDPKRHLMDVALVAAMRAGYQWVQNSAQWLEHGEGCGVPAGEGECTCDPSVGFSNGEQSALVRPDGNITIQSATAH